jgi:hypothetical protein
MGSVLQLQTLGIEYLTTDMKTERKKQKQKNLNYSHTLYWIQGNDPKLVFSLATSSGMKWRPPTKKKGRQHTTRVSPIGFLAFLQHTLAASNKLKVRL